MKCPLCNEGTMRPHVARRFGSTANWLWILASVAVVVAAGLGTIFVFQDSPPRKSDAIPYVLGAISFLMLSTLVLSEVPVWSCDKCGHWANRGELPQPPEKGRS